MEAGCECKKWINLMNAWGPKECRNHIDRIVNALMNEAKRRKWQLDGRPLLSVAARVGALTPWGRAYARRWARSLVLKAIEGSNE